MDMTFTASDSIERILLDVLIAPLIPTLAPETGENLQIGARRARFDYVVDFIRFARVLPLSSRQKVNLRAAWRESAHASTNPEQHQLGDITKIEAHSATVGAAVLANLVPDQVALVGKAPRLHNSQALLQ